MTIRASRCLGTLSALALLAAGAAADAAGLEEQYRTYFMEIMAGFDPDKGEDSGPGNEQAASVWLTVGDDVYVLTYYMNSNVENGNWQCYCNSIRLSPGEMPEVVANKMMTNYANGDRQCNHPDAAASDDWDVVTWIYGSDHENANVQAYARVTDHMCNELVGPLRFSNDNNQNENAADIRLSTVDLANNTVRFSAGYLSTGGVDRTYFRELILTNENGEYSLSKGDLKSVISPANIGRANIATNRLPGDTTGGEFTLLCAARGDNRPPEDGVQCAGIDSETGEIHWKEYVQQSDPGNKVYANQPSVDYMGNNVYAVSLGLSSGDGKNTNKKGSTRMQIHFIRATEGGMQKLGHVGEVGPYQAHSALCTGRYGTDGEYYAALMDASITGLGQPALQMVRFDQTSKKITVDEGLDAWIINSFNGDSGYLANIYGANPNNQGRDFLRCTGDVPNPSYGKPVGFKPNVKSFFVAPHAARAVEEEKNAMFVSFVPAEVDAKTTPQPPSNNEGPTEKVEPEDLPETPSDPPTQPGPAGPVLTTADQGGCTMSDGDDGAGELALLLGLGLLGLAARRREV